MQPVLYLPIEIKYRELPSRLMIAARALGAGYAVVIGNQWSLGANLTALPPGALFFKTVNKIQAAWMEAARGAGHLVTANDEEVLNFIDAPGHLFAFSDNAAAACDVFFAQSPAHAATIAARFPALAAKIIVTGNPRVDLMAWQRKGRFVATDERIAPFRPYILINTNYGTINSIWRTDEEFYAVAKASGAFEGPDPAFKEREFWDVVAWEKSNLQALLSLLGWLAARIQGLSLVVRPHPVERADYWETAVRDIPGAAVVHRSNPHPWILGAELVIHTGCTTGLEAALLGRPALNLLPTDHPTSAGLVNLVNPTFRTWEDAAKALKLFLARHAGPLAEHGPAAEAALAEHLPGYRDRAAIGAIVDAILARLQARGAVPLPAGNAFALKLRAPYQRLDRPTLAREKFSATEDEIADGLDAIAGPDGALAYRLATLDESVYLVTPA